jgi:hypothetical protein
MLNPPRRLVRWPMKLALFVLVLGVVSFPNPARLVRNVDHWSRLNDLPRADEPALQPWVDEFREGMRDGQTHEKTLADVQAFVFARVPYEWDWNTWGNADYLPSLAEILAMDPVREDCDGRAVVAASLLRKLGYDARLVTDMKHVWVWTPEGETMGPGGKKFVESDERGTRFNWAALVNTPAHAAFAVAVFPWMREFMVVLAAWVLLLACRPRWGAAVSGLMLLSAGWAAFRLLCADPWARSSLPLVGAWAGWMLIVVGIVRTARTGPSWREAARRDA